MHRAAAVFVVLLFAFIASAEIGAPATDLNLRRAPTSKRRNVITVLSPSDRFEILEARRSWLRVRVLQTGAEGWVAEKHVAIVPPEVPTDSAPAAGSKWPPISILVLALAGLVLTGLYYGNQQQGAGHAGAQTPNPLIAFGLSVILGCLYVTLTLPKAISTFGREGGWTSVAAIGDWGSSINQTIAGVVPAFPTLLVGLWWAIALYLGSLLLLAIRHNQIDLFTWGLGTFALSAAVAHLFAWTAFVITKVAMFVLWIFGAIARFAGEVFVALVRWLAGVMAAVVTFLYDVLVYLFGGWWWLVPLGAVVVLAGLLIKAPEEAGAVLKIAAKILLVLIPVTALFYGLRWLWSLISGWILAALQFLQQIVVWSAHMLLRLLLGVAVLVAFATIGQLLLDQIHGALSAGRRRRGVIIGAMAIGTSVAILMFVSNVYGVTGWLPSPVMQFATHYVHQPAPLLDALVALAIVALSVIGIWRNMPALGEEPSMAEFGQSLVYGALGMFVAGGLAAIGTQTED